VTGQYSTDWGEMLAAAVTIVLPVVLVFVFLQRRFIEGHDSRRVPVIART
jgi:raffinose/stachyose/melibiose transport system permease protein